MVWLVFQRFAELTSARSERRIHLQTDIGLNSETATRERRHAMAVLEVRLGNDVSGKRSGKRLETVSCGVANGGVGSDGGHGRARRKRPRAPLRRKRAGRCGSQ